MEIAAGAVRASPNAGEESSQRGAIVVRLFGPVRVECHGRAVGLPPSRKVRALLGLLALSERSVLRSYLCDVLWDAANDPRGELRWCLTKLRSVIDDPDRKRLVTDGQWIGLDGSDLEIDAAKFRASVETAIAARSPVELRRLIELVDGELLEGLEAGFPSRFQNWLAAQRQEFAALSSRALAALAARLPPEGPEKLSALRRLLDLAPFEDAAHLDLLTALATRRDYEAGERHLIAVAAAYRSEGLDPTTLSSAWARLRRRGPAAAMVGRRNRARGNKAARACWWRRSPPSPITGYSLTD
jgi:DNA-binding SARP family transcriptional activator